MFIIENYRKSKCFSVFASNMTMEGNVSLIVGLQNYFRPKYVGLFDGIQ